MNYFLLFALVCSFKVYAGDCKSSFDDAPKRKTLSLKPGARKASVSRQDLAVESSAKELESKNENAYNKMNLAILNRDINWFRILLNEASTNEANINETDGKGWTLLMFVSNKGLLEFAELLIEKGADVNIQNKSGYTALIDASNRGHLDVVKLLIENGADLNLQNNYGETALINASYKGNSEFVKLFIESGADLNIQGKYGNTALMDASYKGHLQIVKLLIEAGADSYIGNKRGNTALDIASKKGHRKIVKLLKRIKRI